MFGPGVLPTSLPVRRSCLSIVRAGADTDLRRDRARKTDNGPMLGHDLRTVLAAVDAAFVDRDFVV